VRAVGPPGAHGRTASTHRTAAGLAVPEDWLAVLDALQRGDRVALVKVTRVITGYLARFGAYDLRDSWDDLCQEVLMALIASVRKGALREPQAFISYTGTITRNKLNDWLQRNRRNTAPAPPHGADAADLDPPQAAPADPDIRIDLQRALDELPERHRQVMETVYLQGQTYDDASRRLGMPLGTLKRLLTDGLAQLRKKIGVVPRRHRSDSALPPDSSMRPPGAQAGTGGRDGTDA